MLENKLFEALLDVIPFKAYAVDIETYEVVYANKLMRENMYAPQEQYCWEQVFGQSQICSWCSIEKLKERNLKALKKEKLIGEFFDETDDRWLKTYDELMSWPDGRDVKYSILVDISDQKEIQGDMIKSHAKLAMHSKHLKQTNKNLQITKLKLQKTVNELNEQKIKAESATNSKSQFLANMSHEIRTPMNAVMGLTHLLKETDLNTKQQSYVKKIEISSKNLLNIINDILDFSKIEAGKLELESIDFLLDELIESLVSIVEDQAKEKDLEFHIVKNYNKSDYFKGDPARLGQILLNLLNNAVKFTQKGSIGLVVNTVEDRVVFEVKDTGIGLSLDQREKLFESFTQADISTTRQFGGTGLGLSISKQLSHLMDGEIFIESELGVGSNFIVDIYLSKTQANNSISMIHEESLESLQNRMSHLKDKAILLAEDNMINQEIILGLLEHIDIEIDVVENGALAVGAFKKNPDKYDLILMDIQMPVMDGYEATFIIREENKDIPIVALSANALTEDIEKSKKALMNEHITKPIKVETLYKTLLKFLEVKEGQDLVLNVDHALKLLGGNQSLLQKILHSFTENYQSINLQSLESEEQKRVIHTLKGMAGQLGVSKLQTLCESLEQNHSQDLITEVENTVKTIITNIHSLQNDIQHSFDKEKKSIDSEVLKELFDELLQALYSNRPKNCKVVFDKIDSFSVKKEQYEVIESVKKYCSQYKMKEASIVLEEFFKNNF